MSSDINHTLELSECAKSFVYFCNNYVKLGNEQKFELYDFQKRFINHIDENKYTISKKFKESGLTQTAISWLLWKCLFSQEKFNCAYTSSTSIRLIKEEFRSIINNIPSWMLKKIDSNMNFNEFPYNFKIKNNSI